MSLGERIKEARKAAGLSQAALGAAIGSPQATISRYEGSHRESPDSTILKAIADALNVHMDWLMDGKGPRDRAERVADDPDEDFTAAAAYFVRTMRNDPLAHKVVDALRVDPQWRGKIDGAEGWLDVMKGDLRRAKSVAAHGIDGLGRASARDDGGGPRKVR